MNQKFTCPCCNHPTTITDPNYDEKTFAISIEEPKNWWEIWDLLFSYKAIVCPNEDCRKLYLKCFLRSRKHTSQWYVYKDLENWQLLPESEAKALPIYIPKAIQQDYYESCRIRDLSPKASATLSRRCLQWMIRDFRWIHKWNLSQEIEELKWKVSDKTWKAIDSVRSIWNIGAHMEKDINYIIDVEPNEAQILIKLIEFLIENWHIKRHEEELGLEEVIKIAEQKKKKKTQNTKTQ